MNPSQPRCPYQGETSVPVNSKNPDFLSSCSRRNVEESGDGRVGTLAVLDADWSVTTKINVVGSLTLLILMSYLNQFQLLLAARSAARGHRSTSHF